MAERIYLELLARFLVIIMAIPLLLQVVGGVVSSLSTVTGILQAATVEPEVVISMVMFFLLGFSLVLLVVSIVYLDPLFYSLSLLPLIVAFSEVDLAIEFNVFPALMMMLFSSTILQGYRDGQRSSYRIGGLLRLVLSLAAIAVIITLASHMISTTFWSYIGALRGVEVGSEVLRPFTGFFSGNPLGLALIIILLLAWLYSISASITETLILYLRPSRKIAVKALALDFQAPIKPPLTSLRNTMITLAISPTIYAILLKTLPFLSIQKPPEGISDLGILAIKWALSIAILASTWILVTRMMTRFDEREPGLGGIIAGITLIVIVYLLLYIAQLWDPRVEGLNPGRADEQLLSTVTGYYRILFSIVEIVPLLIGLTP